MNKKHKRTVRHADQIWCTHCRKTWAHDEDAPACEAAISPLHSVKYKPCDYTRADLEKLHAKCEAADIAFRAAKLACHEPEHEYVIWALKRMESANL